MSIEIKLNRLTAAIENLTKAVEQQNYLLANSVRTPSMETTGVRYFFNPQAATGIDQPDNRFK